MALDDTVQETQNPLTGEPQTTLDDLEKKTLEAQSIEELKKVIDEAIRLIDSSDLPSDEKIKQKNNLEVQKNGLKSGLDLVAARARVSEAVGTANFAVTSNTIYNSLSTAGQARVDARVSALNQGRFADYYLDSIDPQNKMDLNARAAIGDALARDSDYNASLEDYGDHPEDAREEAETRMEHRREVLEARIAKAQTNEERAALEKALKYQLHRMPGFLKDLKDASPDAVAALVDEHMQVLREQIKNTPQNTELGSILREHFSVDRTEIDADKVLELGRSAPAEAALAKLKLAGFDYSKLSREDQGLAAAAIAANVEQAKFNACAAHITAFEQMYQKISPKQQNALRSIFDKSLDLDERIAQLSKAYREYGGGEYAQMSSASLRKISAAAIKAFDDHPNAEQAALGKDTISLASYSHWRSTEHRLHDLGYNTDQIAALRTFADYNPDALRQLEFALRAIENKGSSYPPATVQFAQQSLDRSVAVATDPEYKETFSRLRYFNLQDTKEGRALFNAVILDKLSAKDATAQMESMRQQLFSRMEPFAHQVSSMLSAEYRSILQNAQMIGSDRKLDIEKLFEKARTNRDALAVSDAGLKSVTDKKWEDLTPEEKERRVIARAAVRFKAIDALQQFGERLAEIGDSVSGNTFLSETFLNDKKKFDQLNDSSDPQAQKQALEEFLKSLQYLRVNDALRAEVADDIATALASGSLIFSERPAASAQVASTLTVEPPIPLPSASAPSAVDRDREQAFDTTIKSAVDLDREQAFDTTIKMDSREQQGSAGLDSLSKSALEKSILGAVQNLSPETRRQILGSLLGSFNEVDSNFISYNEIENAVRAVDKTKNSNEILSAMDSNGNGMLSLNEITTYLANAGVSGGQGVPNNTTPLAPAVPNAAGVTPTPTPTPGH